MSPGRHPSSLLPAFAFVLLVVVLGAGIGYEQFERAADRDRLPRVGQAVDIGGGRTLNLFCSGSGAPTVLFQSSAPRSGFSWVFIQREVARFTRACWYDRAGFGWSDPGPYPRTAAAGASDLHALLRRAAVPSPYVLVAESFAALDARVYTGLYPQEVSGLVLVDPIHPDFAQRMPQVLGHIAPFHKYIGYPENAAAQFFNLVGVLRLAPVNRRPPGAAPPGITAAEWTTIRLLAALPQTRAALMQDNLSWERSTAQARAAGGFGGRPLLVLTPQDPSQPAGDRGVFRDLQAELVSLSTRGKQVFVASAEGVVPYQAPGDVINTVRQVLAQIHAQGQS